MNRNALLPDREVDSNKLLRDRDGGLWIGTHQRGLIHIHNGRTDVFSKSDGLSGDISCSLFEDREGNVWFASSRGLDRFRELPVATISTKQGLSSGYLSSLVAGADGSVWVGTHDGLTRWKNGHSTIFRKANGLPDDFVNSLFVDNRGRVWALVLRAQTLIFQGRQLCERSWRAQRRSVLHCRETTKTIYGSPGTKASRICGMGIWSRIFPGQPWGVPNKLRF